MFSTYLWKRLSKKLTYFWAVLGSVLLQSRGLALFFHRCYQHLPSPNKTSTRMSAQYCNIIKAKSLGLFLISFMSWTHSTFFYEKYKNFPRDGTAGSLGPDSLYCDAVWAHGTRTTKASLSPNFKFVTTRETREGCGPCWLLKLRWMGTQWVQMKGVLPRLVRWAWFLFCLCCSSKPSTKYFFPHRTLFQFLCPHLPESWAGTVLGRLSLMCLWCRPEKNGLYSLTFILSYERQQS